MPAYMAPLYRLQATQLPSARAQWVHWNSQRRDPDLPTLVARDIYRSWSVLAARQVRLYGGSRARTRH
jgi:hypothetical protein